MDMIGEIDPRTYDCEGRLLPPSWKRPRPSDQFLSYLASGDLAVKCASLDEVQAFLRRCRYVSDSEQFGVPGYWLHPRFFERLRRGDCEDFALWTWRQLLAMGLDARFVLGRCGRGDRPNHAWVTFSDSQTHYLFETTSRRRRKLSRLEILRYKPSHSVSLREGKLVWHDHEPRSHRWTTPELFATFARLPVLLFFDLLLLPGRLVERIAGRIKARKGDRWQEIVVTVNDKLPGSEELICRLLESGIPVNEELHSHPTKPLAQGKRLVTFGRGLPPERIRDVLRAAGDCVDFVQITTEFVTLVYLGAYRVTNDGPEAELTPELRVALLQSNLSTADLWAMVAAHGHQRNRRRRS